MLKQKLNLWIELLESSGTTTEMLAKTEEKAAKAESLLQKNLLRALTASRNLERSYRALSLFYKNTETDKVQNVTILDASLSQLKDRYRRAATARQQAAARTGQGSMAAPDTGAAGTAARARQRQLGGKVAIGRVHPERQYRPGQRGRAGEHQGRTASRGGVLAAERPVHQRREGIRRGQ